MSVIRRLKADLQSGREGAAESRYFKLTSAGRDLATFVEDFIKQNGLISLDERAGNDF
jgi:hypothetical protein